MSTMELETHILSQFRMLTEISRLQVANYIELLIQKQNDFAKQTEPYDEEKVTEQLNVALAEIDQSESLETAHAYMRGMGKYIAENNPW